MDESERNERRAKIQAAIAEISHIERNAQSMLDLGMFKNIPYDHIKLLRRVFRGDYVPAEIARHFLSSLSTREGVALIAPFDEDQMKRLSRGLAGCTDSTRRRLILKEILAVDPLCMRHKEMRVWMEWYRFSEEPLCYIV